MTEINKYKRHTAIKISIKNILSCKFHQGSDMSPSYIQSSIKNPIYRVNIIGILLSKNDNTTLLLDDCTGTILIRSFEENKNLENINPGESIIVIGKVREFNNEKYIAPEIIQKIDPLWMKFRLYELKDEIIVEQEEKEIINETPKEDKIINNNVQEELPFQKISNLINKHDDGNGALIEVILEKMPESKELIDKMLENGDIFQNLPGRVKLL